VADVIAAIARLDRFPVIFQLLGDMNVRNEGVLHFAWKNPEFDRGNAAWPYEEQKELRM
jgi:hypothetical protein